MRRSKPDPSEPGVCKRRALELLARREHSRIELERKLVARGFTRAYVDAALDELERTGALATARFAEGFVRSRAAKGQGPIRIRAELEERGVTAGEHGDPLRNADFDWAAAARGARVKRFGAAPPRDFKERVRQARFLQYRGFDSASIRAALDLDSDAD